MSSIIPDPNDIGRPDRAIASRFVCTPEGMRSAAILISGERIVAVVDSADVPAHVPVEDLSPRWIIPGLVDIHVHINEPGRAEWEGFASATRAAAAGGVTTLVDMPLNSHPVTTSVAALREKVTAAKGKLFVDVGFHAGIVPGNAGDVDALIEAGVCAFKTFLCHSGIDDFPTCAEADLRAVMPKLANAGWPLFAHAEIVSPLPAIVSETFARNPKSYSAYLATRPAAWEVAAIRLLIDLCREYRCRVHIVHLAAARESMPMIEKAKAEGLPLTVETCPHYLKFVAEDIPDGDPRFKCAPPIRERGERDLLRAMVIDGRIDSIGSDHSPAPPEIKHLDDGDLRSAWGGIASLQLLLSAAWTAVRDPRVIAALTSRPAAIAGLGARKGSIAAGFDADLAIFDPDGEFVVDPAALYHRHKATPYAGANLRGRVHSTYLRGRRIFDGDSVIDEPLGTTLQRPNNSR